MNEPTVIGVPKPEPSEYGRQNFAIEVAFNALIAEGRKQGLDLVPVMGLMYLPFEALTTAFQRACRDILAALSTSTPGQ